MYPTSVGTMHQRTAMDAMGWGVRKYREISTKKPTDMKGQPIREYSAVVPEYVKCFTEYLRADGYFCTNNVKTDYNFAAPVTAWDENNAKASWEDCPSDKPFFSVFSFLDTHESEIWNNKNHPQLVSPKLVKVPPYFPDDPIVRKDIARSYSNIEELDSIIGKEIKKLKEKGQYDNTIIFFFSDNGGPLPRGKRETLETGLHLPFIVRFPHGSQAGRVDDMVSFVDFAPTVLSLAGIKPPGYLQGQAFLGKYKSAAPRQYIFGSGDRFDEFTDRIRAARDKRYLFVKNYFPELPLYKDVSYRKSMDMMNDLIQLRDEGKLSGPTALWFRPRKTNEEFYDCQADPFNMNNLIDDPKYSKKISELRTALDKWTKEFDGMGDIPEAEMIGQMWPGNVQPQTAQPEISIERDKIKLKCTTKGSSIAYLMSDKNNTPSLDSGWQLYHEPIKQGKAKYMYVLANRIGYADSKVVEKILEE
jgi:hypothetical protein